MGQFGVSVIFGKCNTAVFGEPGWYSKLLRRPTPEYPLRCLVSSPCAHAAFNDVADARRFLDHPGDIKHLAAYYLKEIEQ